MVIYISLLNISITLNKKKEKRKKKKEKEKEYYCIYKTRMTSLKYI